VNGRFWRKAAIRNKNVYPRARTISKFSTRKPDPSSDGTSFAIQQIRTERGVEQPVAGIERFVGKIHLGDQPLEPAVNLEVNVRRPHPVGTRGIGTGLDGLDRIDAVIVGSNANATDEVRVEWRGVGVIDVNVAAEGVGLPDRDGYAADRGAREIEYSPRHFDDLSLRVPFGSFD
jgi:hypothetical protein